MACKEYEKRILQLGWNEAGNKDLSELKEHLETCASCRETLEKTGLASRLTQKLAANIPRDLQRQETIRNIIGKTGNGENSRREPAMIDRLAHSKFIRFTINAAAVFLIALYCYQQIGINKNLRQLRLKMETKTLDRHRLVHRNFPGEYTGLSESQLDFLIESYDESLFGNREMLDFLKENHPRIYQKVRAKQKETTRNIYEQ